MTPRPIRHLAGRLLTQMAMAAGAVTLLWSGGIHLDLWQQGYDRIPTIGWLFLFQAVTAFVLGVLVLLTRRLVPAAAGALFLASTVAGLVWSVELGLFGFHGSVSAPFATESLVVECAGVVLLGSGCVLRLRRQRRRIGKLARIVRG